MTMFIPRQQLNNMLQAQANQVLTNSTDPTARLIALNTLANTQPRQPADLMQPIPINNSTDSWSWIDEIF